LNVLGGCHAYHRNTFVVGHHNFSSPSRRSGPGANGARSTVQRRQPHDEHAVPGHAKFEADLAVDPNDPEANFFMSVTRFGVLLDNTASYSPGMPIDNLREFLDVIGMSPDGRDLFDWTAESIDDPDPGVTGAHIQAFVNDIIFPEIDAAIDNLDRISDPFSLVLTSGETGVDHDIEVDFGDVLFYKSCLTGAKAAIKAMLAYDLNADLFFLANLFENELFSFNDHLLSEYPNLFTLLTGGKPLMGESRGLILDAIDQYMAASNYIRNTESDPQTDDLIWFAPEEMDEEAEFRTSLSEIKDSLVNETVGEFQDDQMVVTRVDVNRIFGTDTIDPIDPIPLRSLFPYVEFYDGDVHIYTRAGTFPDFTMNGVLPDATGEEDLLDIFGFSIPFTFTIFDETIFDGTTGIDGVEGPEWDGIPEMSRAYFDPMHYPGEVFEAVKVARDADHLYWMVRLAYPLDPSGFFNLMVYAPGFMEFFSVEINGGAYQFYSPTTGPLPLSPDFYAAGAVLEGKVPISIPDPDPFVGLAVNYNYYDPVTYSSAYYYMSKDNILTTRTDADRNGIPDDAGASLPPTFDVVGSVMNVLKPNGTVSTFLEVELQNVLNLSVPDGVDSITVNDPFGSQFAVINDPENYFLSQFGTFFIEMPGSPPTSPDYPFTFEVTAGPTTEIGHDTQSSIRYLPTPWDGSLYPADGMTIHHDKPTFSWQPVFYPDTQLYFRFEIAEDTVEGPGERVFATSRTADMFHYTIDPSLPGHDSDPDLTPGESYWWRVRVTDADNWIGVENRAH